MDGLLLVSQSYVPDDWYGKYYRVLLYKTKEEGFRTKTEAKKYTSKLKKYVKTMQFYKKEVSISIVCDEESKFPKYIYCGNGPSVYYNHLNITIKELEEIIKNE